MTLSQELLDRLEPRILLLEITLTWFEDLHHPTISDHKLLPYDYAVSVPGDPQYHFCHCLQHLQGSYSRIHAGSHAIA